MVEFTATLEKFGKKGEKTGWTYIEIPADVAQEIKPGNKKTNLVGRQRRKATTRKQRQNDLQTRRNRRSFSVGREKLGRQRRCLDSKVLIASHLDEEVVPVIKKSKCGTFHAVLGGGLEPPRLSAYAPQTYVSAIPPPELVSV